MYCVHCGAPNSDTAKFCRNCGKPLAFQALPEMTGEETVPLGDSSRDGTGGYEEQEQPLYADQSQSYGDPSYTSGASYAGQSQTYGARPGGDPSYGGGPSYGSQPDGNGTYESGQLYGTGQPYGNQQFYGNQQPYGTGQSYGNGGWNQQPYGNGTYGGDPSYSAGPSEYGQNPYGYQPSYGPAGGNGKKKKGRKGIVVAVILILLAVLVGGGAFLFIKESDPMAPVDQLFAAVKKGDWEKAYDSIYWGDEGSANWTSKEEFIQEAKSSMGGISSMAGVLDTIKFEKVSEGASYEGNDGLTRRKITVKMSVEFMGMNESQETDMIVVKSGRKFLFIPVWKIDNEGMEELF